MTEWPEDGMTAKVKWALFIGALVLIIVVGALGFDR